VLIHQQLIRAFFDFSNLDATDDALGYRSRVYRSMLQLCIEIDGNLPSVSVLGTVKSSSLVTCLCPSDPTKGSDEGVRADECAEFEVDDREGGKRAGLHGEWELVEVLVDAAKGTPADDGYKS
jgi:hypothetical protein